MNAVSALIDENRYWRIGPGVRDALRHLLHNERIAHYKAKNLGRIRTLFLFKNLTEVCLLYTSASNACAFTN